MRAQDKRWAEMFGKLFFINPKISKASATAVTGPQVENGTFLNLTPLLKRPNTDHKVS